MEFLDLEREVDFEEEDVTVSKLFVVLLRCSPFESVKDEEKESVELNEGDLEIFL